MNSIRFIATTFAVSLLGLSGCAEETYSFDPANGHAIVQSAACGEDTATCPGTPLPQVALENFQPQATDFGEMVSLTSYQGKPLVVALLAAW